MPPAEAAAIAVPRTPPKRRVRLSWADPLLRSIVWQVLIIGAVIAIAAYLVGNTNRNLAARHIATGFAFLGRVAGFPIGESLLPYDPGQDTFGKALLIGIANTLRVASIGCIAATILGTLIGIGRLSANWLVARLTAVYVEVIRDVPLLLQLLFWYALLQGLPVPRQSLRLGHWVFLSNRGIRLPDLVWAPSYAWVLLALAVGIAARVLLGRAVARRQERTGQRPRTWPATVGLVVLLPAAVWLASGAPLTFDVPALHGFNFSGGLTVTPEFAALLIGLTVYTASYIAEIVRSGIQAVPTGQWEAAQALGLSHAVVLRKIVLPQALRVIIPPMTSQYLNLTKNSSLAVAIGYPDIVSVASTTLNQTGQAIEGVAIIMGVYLVISLSISVFMNWYNARIALVER